APGPLPATATIELPRGSSLKSIAQNLKNNTVIQDPWVFVIGTRVLKAQSDLKAGEYEFPVHASARDAMEKIRKGEVVERRVTIPEGLTSYEITELLKNVAELPGEITKVPDEGTILPGTYDYRRTDTKIDVISRMQKDMKDLIAQMWAGRDAGLPITSEAELVTLASIVEKETAKPEERKRVAGVFINRLKAGMKLQTDPTVIYGITKGKHENKGKGPLGRRLLSKDLEVDTPYNTYLHAGLPPGPIANPGAASIEVVLHPEIHEFLYFVADGTGGHVFAKSLKDHEENVKKWRSIRSKK
ncbi:MAG: endolytic transglycosylase MltG, partial [Alphaproteobacteria bacterium]